MKMYCKDCYKKEKGTDLETIYELSYENKKCANCGKISPIVVNTYRKKVYKTV